MINIGISITCGFESFIYDNLGLLCKVNTIQILMHQMRISTNEVTWTEKSWKSKKNCEKCKEPKEKPYCAMKFQPNSSKERAMHEGDILRF